MKQYLTILKYSSYFEILILSDYLNLYKEDSQLRSSLKRVWEVFNKFFFID
ncbi:hypothetical protein BGAPBR_A0060 (plasmid) [Borreliella garinii PBr]|uniref:Uncharacterized protein n=1 Tax=Borreliella garinii PBr TaxID=498743 RepID=B8F1N3_BORGR|nr:hypothetical protein BGAPBR_A0060 [Borreliella garinii PBr]